MREEGGKKGAYAAFQRDVRASRVKELEVEGETYIVLPGGV